jgi:hypothetical protein
MHRTTILLPPELYEQATREAKRQGISLAELIRRQLAEACDSGPSGARPSFFTRKPWVGEVPTDLATAHDTYLYDS